MTASPLPAGEAEPILLTSRDGPVARLTLNRPRAMNCLSLAMLAELQKALDDAAADPSVRAVIIDAHGKGFCAGHDLKEMTAHRTDSDGGRVYYEQLFDDCSRMMLTIRNLPLPVIAQVQGIATAAGCQLVAACDLAVASDVARFGVNGVDSGLFCSTPMVPLSRNIPAKAAMEMLVLGEIVDAERARELGLVNCVVAPEDLEAKAAEFAARAAAKSKAVVALGKRAFYRQREMGIEDAYRYTSKVIVDNMMMRDAEIGIAAFIGKTDPEWEDE